MLYFPQTRTLSRTGSVPFVRCFGIHKHIGVFTYAKHLAKEEALPVPESARQYLINIFVCEKYNTQRHNAYDIDN